ncbi:inactive protein kinase SELMODRAFT_444075-like isoform X1 [Typha angustifolia]|uniref:inactive protein kinase SELMODRAFT_444075-like isoform X1 n=1 Tax=Typha angustifolia TaxID=59011 RepID=UPI003C2E3CA9
MSENVVVVAVRAEREISKTALAWALTHIVRPGDLVTLLAVLADQDGPRGWRRKLLWGFPKFGGECGSHRRDNCQISASCSQMALQIDGHNEVNVRIKVVGSEAGSTSSTTNSRWSVVAAEAKRVGANWIVLDRKLKQEEKHCMEELQCSIVVMKGSCPKVLRLNLGGGNHKAFPPSYSSPCSRERFPDNRTKKLVSASSTDNAKASCDREARPVQLNSVLRGGASSIVVREQNPLFERFNYRKLSSMEDVGSNGTPTPDSGSSRGRASPLSNHLDLELLHDGGCRNEESKFYSERGTSPPVSPFATTRRNGVYWIPQNHILEDQAPLVPSCRNNQSTKPPLGRAKTLQENLAESKPDYVVREIQAVKECSYTSDVREAVSLFGSSPSVPPPLCSICQHKGPLFGKPPRRFTYQELEVATNGFSSGNLVAEGQFGCIYRGLLEDGQVLAVKQLKEVSEMRGEDEFCAEVELLSRAQHRNIVMLVGFCVKGERRALVYEYICNGSLDLHLYGQRKPPLDWYARVKIAVGVARGLRYLHEDCRVGFVVHKDMRPNNILLTHDFEPLLGGFNIRTCQTEKSSSMDAHIARTFGYLAPEYIEYGTVTEKVDVYAYGIVILQLITGRRAMDPAQPKGQELLVEWARPLLFLALEEGRTVAVDRFLDPKPDKNEARFFSRQIITMARAASLCLRRDPQSRPSMSKILRILEGEAVVDAGFSCDSVGSRSSRISRSILQQDNKAGGSLSSRIPNEIVLDAIYAERNWSHFS